jgi:hypothetical protein
MRRRWRGCRRRSRCISGSVSGGGELDGLWLVVIYLLGDIAAQLCAVRFVWGVGVNGDDEMWKLPVDERT